MQYTRREFGNLAVSALPAVTLLNPVAALGADAQAELGDQRRAPRHHHLQLPQHARSERGSDAAVRPRVGHQSDRADGRAGRELCRRAAVRPRRRRWRRWRWPRRPRPAADARAAGRAARSGRARMKEWRTSVSMDRFKALRKMYNDAGVTHLRVEGAQSEHVGRRVRVRLQRRRGARLHAHDARTADRCRAAQTRSAILR